MIQKHIEDLIAENLVSDKIKPGDKLHVDHKSDLDNLTLLINKKEIAS
jgi:ATP-dependent Clp protease ATP-binding subunit ClpA